MLPWKRYIPKTLRSLIAVGALGTLCALAAVKPYTIVFGQEPAPPKEQTEEPKPAPVKESVEKDPVKESDEKDPAKKSDEKVPRVRREPRKADPAVPGKEVGGENSKEITHEGQLVAIIGNRLTMTGKDGKERAFQLIGDARLTLEGKACRATDLKPPMKLRVTTLAVELGGAIRVEGLGMEPRDEEMRVPKEESPQPGPLVSLAQSKKAGDTIAPFRKKWGYDSKTSTPKAKLWSITDSAWLTEDLAVLPLAGSAKPTLAHRAEDGSSLPIGDSSHRADPGATSVTTSSSTAAVIHWPQSSTDPSMGSLVDLEAEVDVLTDRPVLASLCVVQDGTVFSGPAVTIAPAKTFQRVNLTTLVGAKLVGIVGKGENPIATGRAYSFGLVLTPNPGTTLQVVGDNFEVRLAIGCSAKEKQQEQARAKQASLDKEVLLKAIQAIRLEQLNKEGVPGLTSDEIQKEKAQYEAVLGLRPVNNDKLINKQCCNDAEPTFDEQGNLVIEGVPADAEVEATANFVEEELPLADVFAGADTRTDAWLGKLPCSPSIGTFIPQEIKDIEAMTPEQQLDKFSEHDSETRHLLQTSAGWDISNDVRDYPDLATTDLAPTPAWMNNNDLVWTPPATAKLAFEGRDIVFVHGLKLLHIFDALLMDRDFAKVKWQSIPGAGSNSLYAANQAFFPNPNPVASWLYNGNVSTTNYMGDSAFKNWIGDNSIHRGELTLQRGTDFAANLNSIPALAGEPYFPVDGHVGQFLFGNGYQNRFMIASYSSYDRLDAGVRSLLTQVGMAMSDGIGVYNPTVVVDGLRPKWTTNNDPNFRAFGKTGLVFITQSTGALLVDVAMSRATQTPEWKVSYIPEFTRAHISAQGASGGSHVASLANMCRGLELPVFKPLSKQFFTGIDPFTGVSRGALINGLTLVDLSRYNTMLPGTIIQDLRPQIVWNRHRSHVNSTPVQTLVMNGGHPTTMAIQKYWLHPGFDDNTVNTTGTVASRTHWRYWPHGALASVPSKNFDLGLFGPNMQLPPVTGPFGLVTVQLGMTYEPQPLRAIGYYIDQRIDPLLPGQYQLLAGPFVRSHFQASAGSPFKSPTGMVYHSTAPMLLTPWDPYWRAKNHFGFLSVASDHFEATHDQGSGSDVRPTGAWVGEVSSDIRYPYYTETLDHNFFSKELNVEESMAVTSLQPYAPHTPPGLLAHPQISTTFPNVANNALLKDPNFPHVWLTRGCYIEIKARWPKKNPKWQKTWTIWVFKRNYDLLAGWRDKMQFDYVYGTTLNNQALGGVLRQ